VDGKRQCEEVMERWRREKERYAMYGLDRGGGK
jgi:hypothetical protein